MVKFQKKNTLNIFYIRGGEDPNVKILHFFFYWRLLLLTTHYLTLRLLKSVRDLGLGLWIRLSGKSSESLTHDCSDLDDQDKTGTMGVSSSQKQPNWYNTDVCVDVYSMTCAWAWSLGN